MLFWLKFYFYLVHASLRSVHFLVTFISVSIIPFLSAFKDCFAVRILPVIPLFSSPFRLFADSALGFGSIMEGLLAADEAIGVFSEYWCSVDKFYFQAMLLLVFLFFLATLASYSGCFFLELRKVLWSKIYSSLISGVMTHCLDRISPLSSNLLCKVLSWCIKTSSTSVPSLRALRYSKAL